MPEYRGLPTRTWYAKHASAWSGPLGESLRTTFMDLSVFLARPKFYNSILVGDGTPPTRTADGVWVDPPMLDVHAVLSDHEDRIAALEP